MSTLPFAPRGGWLATGRGDTTARLWVFDDGEAKPQVLRGHKGSVSTLAFDPRGRWLAIGGDDTSARLYQLNVELLLKFACRTAGRNLTPEEWDEHLGKTRYESACPEFPSGKEPAAKPATGRR